MDKLLRKCKDNLGILLLFFSGTKMTHSLMDSWL